MEKRPSLANLSLGALVEPAYQVWNPGIGVLGRAGVALAQQTAHHIAGFGQRVVDAKRVAEVDQIVFQRLGHTAVVEGWGSRGGAGRVA